MSTVKTVYEVVTSTSVKGKRKEEERQRIAVTGTGQKAAYAVDSKFKGTLFRKIFKGFQIGENFVPFELPRIYS